MAYGLKYRSTFGNTPPFYAVVSVEINKKDYSGTVIDIRVSDLQIESNYINDDTPVIGKGAKVSIIADLENMTFLEDLLLSAEKEFECIIKYNGEVAFRGWSLCDLNERQLLPYAVVTIEFTDYLHRTEGKYPSTLQPIGGVSNLMSIVQSILAATGFEFPLYVNSTLFENSMDQGVGNTFLPQVLVQNSAFYENSYSYDNIYDAVNKALKSFSAFIYSYKDMWFIERQEDITRNGNWVRYDPNDLDSDYDSEGDIPTGLSVPNVKLEINKQAGDFEYVDLSQVAEYDSGVHTLILKLRDKKLDSLIFNDWPAPDQIFKTAFYAPLAGTLEYRIWYVHEDFTDLTNGTDRRDINEWIHYTPSETFVKGLCYNFAVYFNQDSDNPTVLSIAYSQATNQNMTDILRVGLFFFLRIDGGPYSNFFIKLSPPLATALPYYDESAGVECINLIGPISVYYNNAQAYNAQEFVISEDGEKERTWNLSKEFDFTNVPVRLYNNGTTFIYYPNGLLDLLGDPEYQKFNITFCSPLYSFHKSNYSVYEFPNLFADVYLGDINVGVNAEEIDNEITYVLNKDFIKTKDVDLYLFDLKNLNYSNALLELDEFTRTSLWTSENSPIPIPLYEVFAKCLFRKYGRTIHRLKATIKYDGILKPFTVITDNKILNSDSSDSETITFLLNKFTWNPINGTYNITADEYTEEEVIVDGVTYDSEGNPEEENVAPDTPTGLSALMYPVLFFNPIYVKWNAVPGGVDGYILSRRPYVAGGTLVDFSKLIYVGNAPICMDFLLDIRAKVTFCTVYYKVACYRGTMTSPYSAEFAINWHR